MGNKPSCILFQRETLSSKSVHYTCPWKAKSGTKSTQRLPLSKRYGNLWETHGEPSSNLLKVAQLVNIQARIRTQVAKINEMISVIHCPRLQTQIRPNTWGQPLFCLGEFCCCSGSYEAALINDLVPPSSRGPSPRLGLHSGSVSCLVPQGWSACLGCPPSPAVSGVALLCPGPLLASIRPGSLCLLFHCLLSRCHTCRGLATQAFILLLHRSCSISQVGLQISALFFFF